ncbi:MAG: ABC transporter permease [Bacteroidetes bacterium]|nr:ABC transporter permease [Bacteroidota bacterium]MBU1115509.1 ABC transporter permease [Bacteroidota bacterium]MBU1799561.1 ABC transporter permease [Bacteroidota bacterium]
MFTNNIRFAIRNILKNKVNLYINVFGFAFSIAVFLLISIYLIHENSFDKYHIKADNIYRLIDSENNSSKIDYRVSEILRTNFPEVNNSCIVQIGSQAISIAHENNGLFINNIMSVDNRFFEIFSIPFLDGKSVNPLPTINSAVISESVAKMIFGTENPIGKEILLRNNLPLIVSGVINDFPKNSSMKADLIVNAENDNFKFSFTCGDYNDKKSHRYPVNIYLEVNENADVSLLMKKINNHSNLFQPYVKSFDVISLEKMYLEDTSIGADTLKGNPYLLNLMLTIAIIILSLAIINYINLSLARQSKLNKQSGIKKIIGASRTDIVLSFLIESVLVTTLAFFVGIILLVIGLPIFNDIVKNSLNINVLLQFPYSIILVLFILLFGLFSGIVPAILISSFQPINMLGRASITRRKSPFRNALTVFQFSVSITLIFCITVIYKQISFVKHKNIGFEKEQLLRIDGSFIENSNSSNALLLLGKFKQFHGINNVSLTNGAPGKITNHLGFGVEGKDQLASIIYVDSTFLQTFKIKQIIGRDLLDSDIGKACMINKKAYEYLGWNNLENKRFNNGRPSGYEVIGVVDDFNFASLYQPIEPLCIIFQSTNKQYINVSIAKGKLQETMAYINTAWTEVFPYYPLKYQFYDDWVDLMFRNEEKLAKTVGLFALLAICISSIGILGLAIFTTENSKKEIGIRKVYGAKVKQLIVMLNLDYIKWVVVSIIIAFPIGWLVMEDWLEDFTYRTEISWWVFALAGVTALGIALFTVSFQSYKAAVANPVDSLRNE